jgi:hypothetical protein
LLQRSFGAARANVLVDTGTFVGQDRAVIGNTPTVYDISIEYIETVKAPGIFNLYMNNKLIVRDVKDDSPLSITPNIGLFVRGSSKVMFENVFAVGYNAAHANNYNDATMAQYLRSDLNPESMSDVFRKFSLNQFISDSYLTGISAQTMPKYTLFYDEFGTIMRECFYFKIKYDNAYPALVRKDCAYIQQRPPVQLWLDFRPTPYGADFLVFNNTDKASGLGRIDWQLPAYQRHCFYAVNFLRIHCGRILQERYPTSTDYTRQSTGTSTPAILAGSRRRIVTSKLAVHGTERAGVLD